jgi:hypothetical protein
MPLPKITRETAQAAVDAFAQHGTKIAAAQSLGWPISTFKKRLTDAAGMGVKPGMDPGGDPKLLRAELKRLESSLRDAEAKLADSQVTETKVREALTSLRAAPISIPNWVIKEPKHSSPGVPTLFGSDWHWDEVVKPAQIGGVNEFNREIAHKRLHAMVETAIYLLRILSPKMDYPGIVFPWGGDMISGNIHDELVATNQFNTMPTILDILGALEWAVNALLEEFPRVFIPCVTGNHGRNTHKIWTKDRHATSFDWLIYNLMAQRFKDNPRVTFLIPDGSDAYYRVYGHRFLLTHGDQFRGGDGMIGALGPIIRGDHKKRSRNAQIDMEYDTMLLGHWHQYIHLTRLIVNGSLKGYDEYAFSNNFGFEEPQQALWINHPKYGITFRMPVKVDRDKKEQSGAWVSIK